MTTRVVAWCAVGLASLAAIGCETVTCNLLLPIPSATLQLQRAVWTPGRYDIELSYEQPGDRRSYACSVRLPVAVVRESESGGRTVATIDDAGVEGFPDAGGSTNPTYHNCLPTSSDGQSLDLSVGRGLALTIADTPAEVHLVVRESGNLIFEDDLSIEYQTEFPSGPNCRSVERGQVFVRLPNSES